MPPTTKSLQAFDALEQASTTEQLHHHPHCGRSSLLTPGVRALQRLVRHCLSTAVPLAVLLLACLAQAAAITVTSNADSGVGSLRQAIADAAAGDTINFDPALNGEVIALTSGELVINKDLVISGPGAKLLTISGSFISRVFLIESGAGVNIMGLNISKGLGSMGGGILNHGRLNVAGCTIASNSAKQGGGIANLEGVLDISNSAVFFNDATEAGAIWNSGTLTVSNTTVSKNHSYDMTVASPAIVNAHTLTIVNSTITSNAGGGIDNVPPGFLPTLKNTIILGNYGPELTFPLDSTSRNNLIELPPGLTSAQIFGPLADNGGPTFTHALVSGSPAIDAGDDASSSLLTTDQRGESFARQAGKAVDIGAFEVQVGAPPIEPEISIAAATDAILSQFDELAAKASEIESTRASKEDLRSAKQSIVDELAAKTSEIESTRASKEDLTSAKQSIVDELGLKTDSLAKQATLDAVKSVLDTRADKNDVGVILRDVGVLATKLATQASVDLANQKLDPLNASISTRASQASVNNLAASVASQTSVTALDTKLTQHINTYNGDVDVLLQAQIEHALAEGTRRLALFYLPPANGGQLEFVKKIVRDVFNGSVAAGQLAGANQQSALSALNAGDTAFTQGKFKMAYDNYVTAYRSIVK